MTNRTDKEQVIDPLMTLTDQSDKYSDYMLALYHLDALVAVDRDLRAQ